jgi:hypothetical protein
MSPKLETNPEKSKNRITLNTSLLSIAVGIFFLTINLRSELLLIRGLVIQLVLAIPLLFTSILSYAKVGYRKKTRKWDTLGFLTFSFAYAFILNVIGILLANIVSLQISLIFFASSWILAIIYSIIDTSYKRRVIKERIVKDLIFISIQLFFGVFVVLGIY